jgi:hypothetical protein
MEDIMKLRLFVFFFNTESSSGKEFREKDSRATFSMYKGFVRAFSD